MRKKIQVFAFVLLALIAVSKLYAQQSGGPDSYGYAWRSNQAPTNPITYNWIDITSTGQIVPGLADDNQSGAIPMGINFPFYWNNYQSCYIGSNGYLMFHYRDNIASGANGFPTYPTVDGKRNFIGGLLSDLTFVKHNGDTIPNAKVYYQTIGTKFVVSFIQVPFWNQDAPYQVDQYSGSNTFQFILDAADSSITLNYKDINGPTYSGYTVPATIGMENISERIGLSIKTGLPTNGWAVKIKKAANAPFYTYKDVAANYVFNEDNGGLFKKKGKPFRIYANIANQGTVPYQSNIRGLLTVLDTSNNAIYSLTKTITASATKPFPAGKDSLILFDSIVNQTTYNGAYTVKLTVSAAGQSAGANSNDVVTAKLVQVDTLPGGFYSLGFDSRRLKNYALVSGGYGIYFEPPTYPTTLTGVEVAALWANLAGAGITTDSIVPITVALYNGSAIPSAATLVQKFVLKSDTSYPGDSLAGYTITRANGGSFPGKLVNHKIGLTRPYTISSGGVYLGVGLGTPQGQYWNFLNEDTLKPFSNRTYEITGGAWSPSRDRTKNDFVASIVTRDRLPAPAITASRSLNICTGDTVTLTSSVPFGNTWSTNDTTASIKVSASGTYSVHIRKNGQLSDDASVVVTVNPIPVTPTITTNKPTTICVGNPVKLTADSAVGYLWSTGQTTRSVYVDTAGNYTVKVIGAGGCTSAVSAPVTVTVRPNPLIAPVLTVGGATTFCAGDSVVLTAPNDTTAQGYIWSTGDTTKKIMVKASGTYTLQIHGRGCTSVASLPVVVKAGIAVASVVASGPTTFCKGNAVTLAAPLADHYIWSNGDTTQTITTDTSGSFNVKVVTANNCTSAVSPTTVVTVNPKPAPAVVTVNKTAFCVGDTLKISLTPIGTGYTYHFIGDTTTYTGSQLFGILRAPGTRRLRVIAKNPQGCVSDTSQLVTVTIKAKPARPVITASGISVCAGTSTTLTVNSPQAGATYTWNDGTTGTSRTLPNTTPGTYTYRVFVSGANLCSTDSSSAITVTVKPVPITPTIGYSSGTHDSLLVSGGTTYIWYNGATKLPNTGSSIYVRNRLGNYTVYAVTAGCTSAVSQPFAVVGVQNLIKLETSVYPNPFTSGFTLKLPNYASEKVSIQLLDEVGREVYNQDLVSENGTLEVNTANLIPGVYIMKVNTAHGISQHKLIKN